jgi:hypothetical protein
MAENIYVFEVEARHLKKMDLFGKSGTLVHYYNSIFSFMLLDPYIVICVPSDEARRKKKGIFFAYLLTVHINQ